MVNTVRIRSLRISNPTKVFLLSIHFLLYSLVPITLSAADVPTAPVSVSASDGSFLDIVRITWPDVGGETGYEVFRCTSPDTVDCGAAIDTLQADSVQYDDTEAINVGGKHYYRLKACNAIGCGDFSLADLGFTKLISGDGYEEPFVTINDFTINGATHVILPVPPTDPVSLDWSTRGAEYCEASSTPDLEGWNAIDNISTYGPKSIQFPNVVDSYDLSLTCYSAPDLELSKYVTVSVGDVPEAPTLNSAIAGDQSVELSFTANGDGGSVITGYTAKCGAITQSGPSSPIAVSGLTNGVQYTCSVLASNVLGDSPSSNTISVKPRTVPEAPTLVSATAGDQNAILSFTSNGNGGSVITGYTATCGAITQSGASSPITVGGLTNGVQYNCSVVASNAEGDSGASNSLNVTPVTVPDAPTLVTAVAGDQNAVLSFTSNGNGGSVITGYTATCGAITQSGASSPITVGGLTNGVQYTCSVVASNAEGDSGASNTLNVTPVAPVQVSITKFDITTNRDPQPVSCGDTSVDFEWEAYGADHCYGSWAESASNPSGLLFGSLHQQTGALYGTDTVLFEDLAKTQQFTLICENDTDDMSQVSSLSVKAPCLTTRTESWESMFTREWHGPKSYTSNTRITGDKTLAIRFNTGPVFSKTSTSSPITITGLQRGAQYSCSVVANNASGQSAPSNLKYINPVETVPEPPTLISATPGDGSAQLTFTAREDLFGIEAYQAKCGTVTQTGNSSPITVNNLTNGTGYFCTVTARNDLGIGDPSNEIPVTPQAPSLFVASAKGGSDIFQASSGNPGTSATVPSAPVLYSLDPGHRAVELSFEDNVSTATSYTASCKISAAGGVRTIEFGSTRGERLLAISRLPGDFDVADECKERQYLDGLLIWKTEGSDYSGTACELEPNTNYYWNLTFTDGVNKGTSSCDGTPCQTYIRVVSPDYEN